MYKNYHTALLEVAGFLFGGFQSFENEFAPLSTPDNDYINRKRFDLKLKRCVGVFLRLPKEPSYSECVTVAEISASDTENNGLRKSKQNSQPTWVKRYGHGGT
jgi:hypothetical protein